MRDEEPDMTIGIGMPAGLHLEAVGHEIYAAFGHLPYLVGSAAVSKQWRDVDLRLILPDDEFDALFPGINQATWADAKWALLCAGISELAKARTGLPVDFQIQRQSWANAKYQGYRHPVGLRLTPTADPAVL